MKVDQIIKLLEAVPPDTEVMIKSWNDDGDHESITPVYRMEFSPEYIPINPDYPSRPNQFILS